jgi:uncharacterized hydrophobic protein (TIGR00341 family)
MRLIEVIAEPGHLDTLLGLAEQHGALDCWYAQNAEDQRASVRMLVADDKRQTLMDSLQHFLGVSETARIVVLPVEAVVPRPVEEDIPGGRDKKSTTATREELYNQIERGARLDGNFLFLVFLSTIVAAIGLLEDNVAVVVGAMVIAPLLGPNIALAFAATLGDRDLLQKAVTTSLVGLLFTLLLSICIGWVWPVTALSTEILARTDVGYDGVVLALASGAAAVLSLTSGLASALVGVMVAVALLPPTATLGMMLAAGHTSLAAGAAMLLAVNIVSVNFSANLVFLFKGVRPRTWIEKRKARQSAVWIGLFWSIALAVLLVSVYLRRLLEG